MEGFSWAVLLVLVMVAFSAFVRGDLKDWARAKFLNAADPHRGARVSVGDVLAGGGGAPSGNQVFGSPIPGAPVISTWGDPRDGGSRRHQGWDYSAGTGTPIGTVAPGRVTVAGSGTGYGLWVEVDHGGGLRTRYAHLSRFGAGIRAGATVETGQTIGYVGATGNATGPHLHFEVRVGGRAVDPAGYMKAGVVTR